MENGKGIKWLLEDAIDSGRKSLLLLTTYGTELQPRLRTDEQAQHKANVDELATRVSGQKQALTTQKSNTQGQEAVIASLNDIEVSIRNIVRQNNASKEITIAYGVGDRIVHTVSGVISAGNVILDAYDKYQAWSKDAGIIEADLTEINTLMESLTTVEQVQDDSMFVRKSKTMDKNTLQRAVEDEVSRLSALGIRQFSKNPSVASLFEDLIPASHKPKTNTPKEIKAN
jgi:hypothetical protein